MSVLAWHVIESKEGALHYALFGKGAHLVIAFPGFAQSPEVFSVFESKLGNDCTFILPQLTTQLSVQTVASLLLRLIQSHQRDKYSTCLLGFSIGSRPAAALAEALYPNVNRLILIASPSIRFHFLYKFCVQTVLGRSFFQLFVKRGNHLSSLIHLLGQLSLINKTQVSFLLPWISQKEKRQQVYNEWMQLRSFDPFYFKLAKRAKKKQIKLLFLYGSKDKITPKPASLWPFSGKTVACELLNIPHKLQTEETSTALLRFIGNNSR